MRGGTAIRALAILDHGRKIVTVMTGDTWHGTWGPLTVGGPGSRVSSLALEKIARDGWRPARGAEWVISPKDNGVVIDVVKNV